MTGLFVLVAALTLAVAFGWYRRRTDGRIVTVTGAESPGATSHDAAAPAAATGGHVFELGQRATLVQFSTDMCAPCRPTRELLTGIAAVRPGVTHIEIDAIQRLDLVERFEVRRTPTVLILDGAGRLRHRVAGVPKLDDLHDALDGLCAVRS